jgi:putative transposase
VRVSRAVDHGRGRNDHLKRRRHTPEQIIRKLREADRLLGDGKAVPEVAKAVEVSEATFHRWRTQFGGMMADEVKRLKELERENASLKVIVADRTREMRALTDERSSRRGRGWAVAFRVSNPSFVGGLGELALGGATLLAVEVVFASTGTAARWPALNSIVRIFLARAWGGYTRSSAGGWQVPEQRGHLAGGRDGLDGMRAAGTDALVERGGVRVTAPRSAPIRRGHAGRRRRLPC